jgi:membrane protein YqaA with SNARE-associated domain
MSASAARGGWLRHVSALSSHRYSTWALAAVAFGDSAFLPIPPDLLLVPMILLRPARAPVLLVICTLIAFYGHADSFAVYQRLVHDWGFWFIIGKAFTPIPFMVATIAAGVAAMSPVSFMLAVIIARGVHFTIYGTLLVLYGGKVLALVARYERPFAVVSVLVVIGLVVAYHFR